MYAQSARDVGASFRSSNFHDSSSEPQRQRSILHCDANSFFASVETVFHPEYALVPMAVCGSVEERHGIVLAKNELAKKYKVKTGEPIWQAKQKCPSLVCVRPTYGAYAEFSKRMNEIFADYTDLVEPFGIDESWLDVTGSRSLFGTGESIAEEIRKRVKNELGITVSIGVSFNKVFAKLGSDLKKPDAVTVIPYESFASKVWHLPVGCLLFAGPSLVSRLSKVGIYTIGDLATADERFLTRYIGKNGLMLRDFAGGRDFAPVSPIGYEPEPKSVSNGMTFRRNIKDKNDRSFAVTYLSHMVATRLRSHGLKCRTVALSLRFPDLSGINRRAPAARATSLACDIANDVLKILYASVPDDAELYSLTVHAENLVRDDGSDIQQLMFPSQSAIDYQKHSSLENAVDRLNARYGKGTVVIGSSIKNGLITA